MNIIISGGSQGIGREMALYLAGNRDNHILVTGRNENALREILESDPDGNISYLCMDLNNIEENARQVKNDVFNHFSRIDILINNAGALIVKDFKDISDTEGRMMMNVNFFGPATLIRLLLPLFAHGSHIVNIASMGGFQGSRKFRGLSYYSSSKAALACLTECLAAELSEAGISVNCLAPGAVQTEMFERAFPGHKAPVQPREMARYIADFALNGGKFYNGKILPVAINDPA
ncbi:MAG: SDR family oxidoreductase [Bacteroidales bacterium]